mgnify:CR=1 FL=1
MKILIADKFPQHWQDVLAKDNQITFAPKLDENTLPAEIKDNEILIVRSTKVTPAVIDAGTALKLIIRAGAGYDTIDTAYAAKKGIAVCNCPGTNSLAVAELAMALMLALDRRIYNNVRDLRDGKWNKSEYSKARGIFGKKLGILGFGNIGKAVAARAAAFGLELYVYDPYAKDEVLAKFNAKRVADVYELAKIADIITVHLPSTEETKGLFNKKFFDAMKDGAYFINTARGNLVNTKDLVEVLKAGKIRAALDVYENEPKATDAVFDKTVFEGLENFYGTHHIGASTDQAQDAVAEMAVQIVNEYGKSKTFLHKVN